MSHRFAKGVGLARGVAGLCLAGVVMPGAGSAQEAEGARRTARTFWLTEAAYAYAVAGESADHYPALEVGPMLDLSRRFAVGATAFVGHNGDLLYGPKPRLRYRVSDDLGIDVAAGMLWGGDEARPVAHAGVSYRDLVSVVVQYEDARGYWVGSSSIASEKQVFLGARIGSRPGLITGLVGTVVGGLIVLISAAGVEN